MSYDILANKERMAKTILALKERGIEAVIVETKAEALATIKAFIPAGASLMNGSSVTLEEIGFIDYLKEGKHGWNNLHEGIILEKDPEKQSVLRKQALLSEYYLGSVHAIAETGELVIGSNSASQLPHVVYSSPNIIFVSGAQKIVSTLDEAMKRLREYVVPLEDKHLQGLYGIHTALNKIVIWNGEPEFNKRKVRMILVNEKLGF